MMLSENFTLAEMTRSLEATRKGWRNDPDTEQIENLRALTVAVVQPTRDHFGKPAIINSGFRSPMLNASVGGSPTSQHLHGEAVDFEIPGIPNFEVADYILKSGLPFDQLILEYPDATEPSAGWIHVSHRRDGKNRGQALTAIKVEVGGKKRTRYLQGIMLPDDEHE